MLQRIPGIKRSTVVGRWKMKQEENDLRLTQEQPPSKGKSLEKGRKKVIKCWLKSSGDEFIMAPANCVN